MRSSATPLCIQLENFSVCKINQVLVGFEPTVFVIPEVDVTYSPSMQYQKLDVVFNDSFSQVVVTEKSQRSDLLTFAKCQYNKTSPIGLMIWII